MDMVKIKESLRQVDAEIARDRTRRDKLDAGLGMLTGQMLKEGVTEELAERKVDWVRQALGIKRGDVDRMKLREEVEQLAFGNEKEKEDARKYIGEQLGADKGIEGKQLMERVELLADVTAKDKPGVEKGAQQIRESREWSQAWQQIHHGKQEEIAPPFLPTQKDGPGGMGR